jgi:hypothetical protein
MSILKRKMPAQFGAGKFQVGTPATHFTKKVG